jgi:hypothetical protein
MEMETLAGQWANDINSYSCQFNAGCTSEQKIIIFDATLLYMGANLMLVM